ncbi:MAG: cell division protein ZapA [Magnetococcales bacterium]|nr:cell division protein ZapA [Magnetococcales bacterium]
MAKIIEVIIHGQAFKMRANDGGEYLQRVARYVDEIITQMVGHHGNQPSNRLAIMAAMQITDSLFQEMERKKSDGMGQVEAKKIEDLLTRLIDESDRCLGVFKN